MKHKTQTLMVNTTFRARHIHYQVLYEYALLEYELNLQGKPVPRLPLKEPQTLLKQIKTLRQNIQC
jgi:hypothetical protein